MSALNLIVTREAAYIVTDRVGATTSGMIGSIAPKVIAAEHLGLIVGFTGISWPGYKEALEVFLASCRNQPEAMAALPDFLRRQAETMAELASEPENAPLVEGMPHVLMVAIGLWNAIDQWAEGYVIVTGPGYLPDDVEPFKLRPTRGYTQPRTDLQFDPADPDRSAIALIDAQRETVSDWGTKTVGGAVDLATVDSAGPRIRMLREYPDRIGFRIGEIPDLMPPARPGIPALYLSALIAAGAAVLCFRFPQMMAWATGIVAVCLGITYSARKRQSRLASGQ